MLRLGQFFQQPGLARHGVDEEGGGGIVEVRPLQLELEDQLTSALPGRSA